MVAVQDKAAEQVRAQQREEWSAAAPGWIRRRQEVSEPTRPVTERLLALAQIRPGQRVLDLACGTGDPAFTIAERIGPSGVVLGLDQSPEMIDGARAWAREHAVRNVEFRQIRSELELGVADASFDIATCRHGLMYMPDPVHALQAVRAALTPGGRVAVSTWGPPERFPAFVTALQIIMRHVELPAPDPTAPGPMALPTRAALEHTLQAAGFTDVESVAVDVLLWDVEGAAACWDLVAETSGPLVPLLAGLPEQTRQAIREDAVRTFGALFPDGRVRMGGEAIVAAGVNPR